MNQWEKYKEKRLSDIERLKDIADVKKDTKHIGDASYMIHALGDNGSSFTFFNIEPNRREFFIRNLIKELKKELR